MNTSGRGRVLITCPPPKKNTSEHGQVLIHSHNKTSGRGRVLQVIHPHNKKAPSTEGSMIVF